MLTLDRSIHQSRAAVSGAVAPDDETGALAPYESLGFVEDRTELNFHRPLPGDAVSTQRDGACR